MNTIQLLKNHTSIRKFNEHPITDVELMDIIQCAKQGATAGNMMMYSIIVVKSKDILAQLAQLCDHQSFIKTAQVGLLFLADNAKWHHYFMERGIAEQFDYTGPTISDMSLAIQDAMIAAQNSVISAESMGIGTCYIGDIMENYETIKSLFNLPKYVMPATLVVMGKYDVKPQVRDRFEDQYCVFDHIYPNIDNTFVNGMFKKQEEKKADFATAFYKRKMDAPFFKEMNRSIEKYIKEWQE